MARCEAVRAGLLSSLCRRFASLLFLLIVLLSCSCEGAPTLRLLWKHATTWLYVRTPLVAGGRLYAMTRHGEFAALDLQTGDILFETVMPTAGVYATPVIRDSVLYITGSDSDVTAIDAVSGEVIWHVLTAPYVYQDCMGGKVRAEYRLTTPIMHGGRIYVGSGDGKVYALNLDDGEGLWECPLSGYAMGDPCLADSTLFVVSYTDRLNAINIDHGELLWFMEIGTELVYAKPAVLEKKVFVASRDGQVFAISLESRQVTWARSVGTRFMTGPVVADDNVWIADESGVYCLAAEHRSGR
jgi:outer membrane protein assembly factor BamB